MGQQYCMGTGVASILQMQTGIMHTAREVTILGGLIVTNFNMVAKPAYYAGLKVTGNYDLSYFPEMPEDFVYLGINLMDNFDLHEQRLLMVLQEPQQPVRCY